MAPMNHGLDIAVLAVVSGCVLAWSLVSARLERWDVSAPIAFVVLGVVVTHGPTAMVHLQLGSTEIRSLAELTLALVLFADASRVNVHQLRALSRPPDPPPRRRVTAHHRRGGGRGLVPLRDQRGLGGRRHRRHRRAHRRRPGRLGDAGRAGPRGRAPAHQRRERAQRRHRDAVPVNLFLAAAATTEAVHGASSVATAVIELVGGVALGLGVGVTGAVLLALSRRHRWSSPGFRPLAIAALALFACAAALVAGTNGFVAAFVAGMAFGTVDHHNDEAALHFTEEVSLLLSMLVWFGFGAVMLVPGLEDAGWRDLLFALLALTVLRMAPVALALAGSGLDRATVAFVGWFGPRGLASVVFGLIAVDSLAPEESRVVLAAVTVTVALSVLLHGVSASPLASRYGAYATRLRAAGTEPGDITPVSTRSMRSRRATAGPPSVASE